MSTNTRPLNVFLDANVVIRAGKPPSKPLIPRVADLVDAGYVKVLTTDLTKMEIAKKHADNDFELIGQLMRKRARNLITENFGVTLPDISPTDLHQQLLEKYHKSVEQMFESLRAETLSIDSVKPSIVFDAYTRRSGLFGLEAKKDQFPDAFIFEVLKAAAKKSGELIIVSDDKDFAGAINEDQDRIRRIKSIADLFTELGLLIDAAPDVADFIDSHLEEIIATVNDELNNWDLLVYDVQDAEIDESDVEGVTFVDFRVFHMAGEVKDILLVGRIDMNVKVSYHHPDWDTASYDSEDKVLLPHRTSEGERNIDMEADFSMTLKTDSHGRPISIAEFSFDDDDFNLVSITPDALDLK